MQPNVFIYSIGIIVLGLVIGILAGFSVSPVISVILTALVAAGGTVVAVLGGFAKKDIPKQLTINPFPLAILALAILIGAFIGMYTRINWAQNLLDQEKLQTLLPPTNMQTIIDDWGKYDLENDTVAKRIYELYLPKAIEQITQSPTAENDAFKVGLLSIPVASECTRLKATNDSKLRGEMQIANSKLVQMYADAIDDSTKLKEFVDLACQIQ